MFAKKSALALASQVFISSFAVAGSMGPLTDGKPHYLASVLGGYANFGLHHRSQLFVGTDDNQFLYLPAKNNPNTGFAGVLLGAEYSLPYPNVLLQIGAEYDYFTRAQLQGLNSVGIDSASQTVYDYQMKVQSQQIQAVAKLMTTYAVMNNHQFHPYLSLGVGAAINNALAFNAQTQETGSVNSTPQFNNGKHTSFSYSAGLGVDTTVSEHTRFGLGYRFAQLGTASFRPGYIAINQVRIPVEFSLHAKNLYTNQLVVQLSYLA